MTKEKQAAVAAVEAKKDLIAQVADSIWDYAELSLQETRSAALYCEVLAKEGFTVEKGICNIDTAFSASYSSGRPSSASWRSTTPSPVFPRRGAAWNGKSGSPAAADTAAGTICWAPAPGRGIGRQGVSGVHPHSRAP